MKFFRNKQTNDETQLGLSGSTSKECGVDRPAFLTYFYFKLSGNQRVQSNGCQSPPPQLSKIFFVTGNTVTAAKIDPDHLACVAWRYKAAKQNEWRKLCRSFSRLRRLVHALSNCLNRQAKQATDILHACMDP